MGSRGRRVVDMSSELVENFEGENMDGLQKDNNGNVTNVYNSTVNNMTVLTSTIACIDYMRRNKKAMIIPIIMAGMTIGMLIASFILFGKASNMYISTNGAIGEADRRVEAIERQLIDVTEKVNTNTDLAGTINENEEKINRDIESIKRELDTIKKKQPTSVENKNSNSIQKNSDDTAISEEPITELSKLKIVSGKSAEVVREATNTVGEKFSNAILLNGRGDTHVTYYLGKKYTKLSFKMSCPDEEHITEVPAPLEIYADNDSSKLLYYMDFSRITATTDVELDVSNVEFITFRVTKNSVLYDAVGLIIADGKLQE